MAPKVPLQKIKERNFNFNRTNLNQEDLYIVRSYNHVFSLPIMFCSVILGKLCMCLFVLFEEFKHKKSRHNNSFVQLLKNCFQVFLTMNFIVGFFILLGAIFLMRSADVDLFTIHWSHNWPDIITSIGVSIIANYALGFKSLSVVELSEIHESSNINVAQGLAWSYFTGYLAIILKDLKKTIEKDERWKEELNKGNLQCKFYAIVPLNCKIPSKLGECPKKHRGITFEGKLPTLYVDRAGVKDRPYVNSVYKIDNGKGESKFAISEYVTIIDTLFQMSRWTAIEQHVRDEQCHLLVRKLQELIDENEDYQNKCVIVTLSGENDGNLLRDVLLNNINNDRVQID
ncbi:stimulator of interferon genes protein-like [Antedon mediterranea]|uniref:stimulator of interferon genes protein-like n=1 Tax=Antedon mediterranea TaxID=105859 RepID=UPI003AF66821